MGVVVKNAELTTEARAKATSSVRNAVSYYALSAYATNSLGVPDIKLLNSDGTSFTVGATNRDATKVVVLKVEPGSGSSAATGKKRPNQTVSKKGGPTFGLYTIKVYITVNGNGTVMDPVYVLQDDDMKEDDCLIHPVMGLGATASISSKGYIVFMKSRSGNVKFYNWVAGMLIPEAVDQIDAAFPEIASLPTFWKVDGEPIQLRPFKDPHVQAKLRDRNIHVGKSPHSCTAIFQECDAGNLFKAAKTVNRKMNSKVLANSIIQRRVQSVIEEHDTFMNPIQEKAKNGNQTKAKKTAKKKPKRKGLSAYHKNLAVNGIMRVQLSLQATVKPQIIRDSYRLCGSVPLDLDRMLDQLRGTYVSPPERSHIKLVEHDLVDIMKLNGEISEADFDELLISEDAHTRPGLKRRDERVIYQRRSVLLTHPLLIEREWDLDSLPSTYIEEPIQTIVEERQTKRNIVRPRRFVD